MLHETFLRFPALLVLAGSCAYPVRNATLTESPDSLPALEGYDDVRAVDGYPSEAFQAAFDETISKFVNTPEPEDGRRDFNMLALSSGGVNGAFGAGVLTAWSKRGDRPEFWVVTGVSVGALMAPFVFAGPEFDERLERLFRRIEPAQMHYEKGFVTSVLWDESLADNKPLRDSIEEAVDEKLMRAVARRHAEGKRCWIGSTNLDIGCFCVWDIGAIASRQNDEALELMRAVMTASASIPVVYPPTRFPHGEDGEMHVDGAVVRPLFIPQNVFDGYKSAENAGVAWEEIDATLYVVHNGSLRPRPVTVQRDTLGIALRTVTMMSYTMVSEHVLHLYMLTRAWGAEFRFLTMPDGLELSIDAFTPDDTERLFMLGQGMIEKGDAWRTTPPGYVLHADLERIEPQAPEGATEEVDVNALVDRLQQTIDALREELKTRDK